jgi:hypothetical protein
MHWLTEKGEGFPSQGYVCNHITGINPNNLVKGQLIYLHGKEIDELCGVGHAKDEDELVYNSLQ